MPLFKLDVVASAGSSSCFFKEYNKLLIPFPFLVTTNATVQIGFKSPYPVPFSKN